MPLSNAPHDLLLQRQLTAEHGEFVQLYQVLVCACKALSCEEGRPDPTCKICAGSGRAYAQPITLKGIIAGINTQDRALLQAGLAMPADLTFTPDLTQRIPIHDYDVITLAYGEPYEGDALVRGTRDTLTYRPAQIRTIEAHNPQTGARTVYTSGYTISGRTITWSAGAGPALGAAYTVAYNAFYEWVVYPGVTLQRVHRGANLGQRVLLRKRHLAGIPVILPAGSSTGGTLTTEAGDYLTTEAGEKLLV